MAERQTRILPASEWPTVTDDDGTVRHMTRQELLNHGAAVVGVDPETGDYLLDCAAWRPGAPLIGREYTRGDLLTRYTAMPPGPLKRAIRRALVIRARDSSDLRAACCDAARRTLEPRVPARGDRSAVPADLPGALAVLAEARRRVEREEADVLEVPMAEVQDGDVVERDGLLPAGAGWMPEGDQIPQ